MRLSRADQPLRREVVEYMLDVDSHMWNMRRSKANFFRIMGVFRGLISVSSLFHQIRRWKNPLTSILIHVLFVILVIYPELIIPTIFLYLFVTGIWNFWRRPRHPPHMDVKLYHVDVVHPDELDEEFNKFPMTKSSDTIRMRYDQLSWMDPRATALIMTLCLIGAVMFYITPFQVIALLVGFYVLRHPRFRHKLPSADRPTAFMI